MKMIQKLGGFTFSLESFELINSEIIYEDLSAGVLLEMSRIGAHRQRRSFFGNK